MTLKSIKDAIKFKFETDISVGQSIPTQYDNQGSTPPENALWIRFSVLPGDSLQKSIGAPGLNVTRHIGIIIIEIFSPIGTGDKDAYDTIELIRIAFIPGTYNGILYRTGKASSQGRVGSWSKINFTIPYQSDELI